MKKIITLSLIAFNLAVWAFGFYVMITCPPLFAFAVGVPVLITCGTVELAG